MRNDIQANEQAFSTKEVAEEIGIATPTVRKYGQILERYGYEFLKDGDRRIFVQSDVRALVALRDTDKPLDETAKDLVAKQREMLDGAGDTEIALSETFENLPQDPNQLKEVLLFVVNELAATRDMNMQLKTDMALLKTNISQLQQDHHVISSSIGNSAQRTNAKIERILEQQNAHYEELLNQERERSEYLQQQLQKMREEQRNEWNAQINFNKRLEEGIRTSKWNWLLSMFKK